MTVHDEKRRPSTPHLDHTLDPADRTVHPDPRATDVGSSGTIRRHADEPAPHPASVDHGIDRVLKETDDLPKDRGGEPADPKPHPDERTSDVGSRGATRR